ncbi:metallophosphoesterase family protein [Candidatus Woesearchaeota archaeon]|nr:metallophosphoesterase family protein [Candidatus Woesearchaeota archaeon]
MKILSFTDTHENLTALRRIEKQASKADVLVCAGDITIFETHIDAMMKRLGKIKKPILIIPGNHETPAVLRKYCSFYKNMRFIHNKLYKFQEYYFLGWGGGGFSQIEKEFEKLIKKTNIHGKKVILVTHAPPYNTKLDVISKKHYGSKSITRYIQKNKNIILHICGHFHENQGRQDKINQTKIINPGPAGEIILI